MYARIKQFSPNFMEKAVLTVSTQDSFVVFSSFDAIHGRSRRIYVRRHALINWLQEPESAFMEHDIHSSIRIIPDGDTTYAMELTSLNENSGELRGFILRFRIDPSWLYLALDTTYTDSKLLITIDSPRTQAKMNIPRSTQAYIRDTILKDPRLKRAFVKAISRNFMYGPDSEVTLHPDYDGFFFSESCHGKRRIHGGLVISEYTLFGFDTVKFNIHT